MGRLLPSSITAGIAALLLADGSLRPWHGHVTRFALFGSDGGLARYKLVIQPWLAFLAHNQDSWVTQDQTVMEIVGWLSESPLPLQVVAQERQARPPESGALPRLTKDSLDESGSHF